MPKYARTCWNRADCGGADATLMVRMKGSTHETPYCESCAQDLLYDCPVVFYARPLTQKDFIDA